MATEADRTLRLDAIVLAAGFGSRFGGGKLTAAWRGGRLIDGALDAAAAAPVREVVVVLGADPGVADAVASARRKHGSANFRTLLAVDFASGMSASLRAGVAGLSDDCAGAFVFLGDMPLVPRDAPPALADALARGALAAAPTFDGRRGHPVLFDRSLFAELLRLSGDEGARDVLKGLGDHLALVPASGPGILLDVDAPADLETLRTSGG